MGHYPPWIMSSTGLEPWSFLLPHRELSLKKIIPINTVFTPETFMSPDVPVYLLPGFSLMPDNSSMTNCSEGIPVSLVL